MVFNDATLVRDNTYKVVIQSTAVTVERWFSAVLRLVIDFSNATIGIPFVCSKHFQVSIEGHAHGLIPVEVHSSFKVKGEPDRIRFELEARYAVFQREDFVSIVVDGICLNKNVFLGALTDEVVASQRV